MRQNNKYLEKVYEEMDIYRQHLLTGKDLTVQQEETFEKIDVVRGWLRDGFSDVDIIKLAKNDPRLRVQDRRAREILAMAYEVFAELRQLRNRDGIKYMYAEMFRKAGQLIMQKIVVLADMPDSEDWSEEAVLALVQMNTSNSKEISLLMKEYTRVMKEAATIDGAYDNSKIPDGQKQKPTKIIIKRKTVIQDGQKISDELNEQAHYELSE
jgi:hypothetical protein